MTTRTENGRFEKGTEKLTTWACGPEKALTGWISINEIRDLWQNRKEVDVPCPIKDNQRVTVSSVRRPLVFCVLRSRRLCNELSR